MRLRHAVLAANLLLAAPAAAAPFVTPERPPEMQGLRAVPVVEGLERPWGMAFLPDNSILVTERPGRLRLVRDGALDPRAIEGVPPVLALAQGGLLDVAIHPRFAENRLVYLAHAHGTAEANRTRLVRGVLDGHALRDVRTVFEVAMAKPMGAHFGSRILFLPDGTLLLTIGDGGNPQVQIDGRPSREQAQNPGSHLGKVLRLNEDGTVPRDNPFLGRAGFLPEIWSWGHRNPQGLAWDPVRRVVWATEHGSQGGDELNLVQGGENHGWPAVTHSVEYRTAAAIAPDRSRAGMTDPALVWSMTAAPSGLVAYTGDRFASWRGDLFSGSLRSQDLRRVRLDAAGTVVGEEVLPVGRRIRDVRQGPDGFLYLLTDEPQGALLRVETVR